VNVTLNEYFDAVLYTTLLYIVVCKTISCVTVLICVRTRIKQDLSKDLLVLIFVTQFVNANNFWCQKLFFAKISKNTHLFDSLFLYLHTVPWYGTLYVEKWQQMNNHFKDLFRKIGLALFGSLVFSRTNCSKVGFVMVFCMPSSAVL
jgi:hypothetical protein